MRKESGSIIIEWFDELGSKVGQLVCKSYGHAIKIADLWEGKHAGNSVVIYRVMYNTHYQNKKWDFKDV